MKPRPVTCIHVAAYLFSALVLGVSAVSCIHEILVGWSFGTGAREIHFENGLVLFFECDPVFVNEKYWFDADASWLDFTSYYEPVDSIRTESHFLGMTKLTTEWKYPNPIFLKQICIVPSFYFLIPPLTWMCGFHLFRLRRRFRARSAVSLDQLDGTTSADG